MCIYIYIYTHIYVHLHSTRAPIYAHTYTHIYIYLSIHTYIYIYIYTYVHIHSMRTPMRTPTQRIPRKGMNAHRHSAHGLKSNMRRYVVGTTCTVCQKEFHTRYRHFRHVSHDSKRCGESLMQLGAPPLSQEQCDELDKADLNNNSY